MKLSIFVCIINPEYWCFPYLEALRSYCDLADEVIVIDSGSTDGSIQKIGQISDKIKMIYSPWPWEFKQREYPKHYNLGFETCTGDWVMKMDIDHILHQDFDIKKKLEGSNAQMVTFQRLNVVNRTQFYDKGKMPTAINKKYPIKVGVPEGEDNTDWTVPITVKQYKDGVPYGVRVDKSMILNTGIPIYNYDCFFRDKEKCKPWYQRIARANPKLYGDGDDAAWEHWKNIRIRQRDEAALQSMKLEDHPIYIQEKIKNMTPDMWGYNNWEWKL